VERDTFTSRLASNRFNNSLIVRSAFCDQFEQKLPMRFEFAALRSALRARAAVPTLARRVLPQDRGSHANPKMRRRRASRLAGITRPR
jgi:hypothetical protein